MGSDLGGGDVGDVKFDSGFESDGSTFRDVRTGKELDPKRVALETMKERQKEAAIGRSSLFLSSSVASELADEEFQSIVDDTWDTMLKRTPRRKIPLGGRTWKAHRGRANLFKRTACSDGMAATFGR